MFNTASCKIVFMRRVFYFNITYLCNNSCLSCISTNVRNQNPQFVTTEDIQYVANQFNAKFGDIWCISGGEPTLSSHFNRIIDVCYSISPFINLYSNGRTLMKIPSCTIEKINRILVPIYGLEQTHNLYVNNKQAYKEAISSIFPIIERDPYKIDIKLMLDGKNSITELLNTKDWELLMNNKNFSVTRVITLDTDKKLKNICHEASVIIEYLLTLNKNIRFYDLPICFLSESLNKKISFINIFNNLGINPEVVCGSSNKKYKLFMFNKQSDYFPICKKCKNINYCCKIMQNYFCPLINKNGITLTTE